MNTSLHRANGNAAPPVPHSKGFAKLPEKPPPTAARWLALGAVVSPVLFTLAWIVLGGLRPGYSLLAQPISDLGLGENALFMNTVFVVSGLLLLIGVVGILLCTRAEVGTAARWSFVVLLALPPLGQSVDGFFTEAPSTLPGHLLGALIGFFTPIVGFLVTGLMLRRSPSFRRVGNWLLLASPLMLVVVFVYFQTGVPGAPFTGLGLGGLTERIMVLHMQAWYAILGWVAFRRMNTTSHHPPVDLPGTSAGEG
jgi:hypothetical membrane protein